MSMLISSRSSLWANLSGHVFFCFVLFSFFCLIWPCRLSQESIYKIQASSGSSRKIELPWLTRHCGTSPPRDRKSTHCSSNSASFTRLLPSLLIPMSLPLYTSRIYVEPIWQIPSPLSTVPKSLKLWKWKVFFSKWPQNSFIYDTWLDWQCEAIYLLYLCYVTITYFTVVISLCFVVSRPF